MFIGPDGCRFYRFIVSRVDRDIHKLYGTWIGIPAPHDCNNFTVSYQINKQCQGTFVDTEDLELFSSKLGNVYVPYHVKRYDELIVHLR